MTIITYYLILQLILSLFFRIDNKLLFCGISAFSGFRNLTKEQAKLALNKIKILGLYNQSRGVHGCGIYINGQIYKGYDDLVRKVNNKEFDNFLADEEFVIPELDPKKGTTILLHNRQATRGAQIEDCTHPFLIESEDPKNNLAFLHNGTIDNIWSLCTKNKIDHSKIHVDSKALGILIDKVGVKILEEYTGAAALIWTKISEPNSIYVYHGAGLKAQGDKTLVEERPMFFMKTEEGVYFSSMPESLRAIREFKKQKVERFVHNIVIKVTNGKATSDKVEINREEVNLPPVFLACKYPAVRSYTDNDFDEADSWKDHYKHQESVMSNSTQEARRKALIAIRVAGRDSKKSPTMTGAHPNESLIERETLPERAKEATFKNIVYYYKGRHRFGNGILCHKIMWLTKKGVISVATDSDATAYFFWNGVMIKNEKSYNTLYDISRIQGSWLNSIESNYAYDISIYAKDPVIALPTEFINGDPFFRFSWYGNGRRITTSFTPKFSGRAYNIKDSFLTHITASNNTDKKTIEDEIPFAQAVEEKKDAKEEVINSIVAGEEGDSFDIIFSNYDEALRVLSKLELQALKFYSKDILLQDSPLDPDHTEIEVYMFKCIKTAVASNKTIREGFGDKDNLLNMYIKLSCNNVQESSEEEPSTESHDEYRERFYHKNGYYPHELDKKEEILDIIDAKISEEITIGESLEKQESLASDNRKLVENRTQEAIEQLSEINTIADELQAIDDDFSQGIAQKLYLGLGNMKHGLAEECENNHSDELLRIINQSINV